MHKAARIVHRVCICQILISSAEAQITVPLTRKAVGIPAQAVKEKIESQLLKSGGFTDEFGQKNIDDHGPIEDIIDEFNDGEDHSHQPSVFEWFTNWMMSFAPKAASPIGAPGTTQSEHSVPHLGLTDFRDKDSHPLKSKLYDSIMEEERKNGYKWTKHQTRKGGKHPVVQADTRIDISNYLNLQYIGPVWMGSANQRLNIIYDTGSDWLVLDTDFCSTCESDVFNTSLSTSYTNVSTTQITQAYGSALLYAVNATDSTSLEDPASSTGTQVNPFNFLAITWQTGIRATFDGIIGFSRQYYTGSFTSGPLFLEALKNESKITREQISFFMTDTSDQSFADLGQYVEANMKGGDASKIAWIPMPKEHLFWYSNVQAIKIGYNDRTTNGFVSSWKLTEQQPAIFDTGTSLTYIPLADSDDFFYRLLKDKTYLYDQGFFYVDCSERANYPDVQFLINDRWFVVSAHDYVQEITGSCYLAFVEDTSSSYWLLGDSFLRGYYSIHDNEDHANARLGFIPHVNSTKPYVNIGYVPTTTTTDLQWERTFYHDIYWAFQIPEFADTWLDSKWQYQWQGELWVWLFGTSSIRRSTYSYY